MTKKRVFFCWFCCKNPFLKWTNWKLLHKNLLDIKKNRGFVLLTNQFDVYMMSSSFFCDLNEIKKKNDEIIFQILHVYYLLKYKHFNSNIYNLAEKVVEYLNNIVIVFILLFRYLSKMLLNQLLLKNCQTTKI